MGKGFGFAGVLAEKSDLSNKVAYEVATPKAADVGSMNLLNCVVSLMVRANPNFTMCGTQ
jgi:hypothetical protein